MTDAGNAILGWAIPAAVVFGVTAIAIAVLVWGLRRARRSPRARAAAEAVRIDPIEQRGRIRLEVRVGPDDMGRVIGKRGRVANAIRTVVRAAAVRDGVDVDVEFED